jgi:hypothetical protein
MAETIARRAYRSVHSRVLLAPMPGIGPACAFTPFSVYLLISFMKLTDFACLPPDSVTGNPSAGHGRAGFDPDSTGAAQ